MRCGNLKQVSLRSPCSIFTTHIKTNQMVAIKRTFLHIILLAIATVAQAQNEGVAWLEQTRNLHPSRIKANDHAPATRTAIRELTAHWQGCAVTLEQSKELSDDDGFAIVRDPKRKNITIMARHSSGLLYGAYELLRIQALKGYEEVQNIKQKPLFAYRMVTFLATAYAQTENDESHTEWCYTWLMVRTI